MNVVAPPPVVPSDEQEELEALIREARARQRRRRLLAAAGVAVVAAGALAASSGLGGGGGSAQQRGDGGRTSVTSLARCRSDQLRLVAPRIPGAAAGTIYEPLTLVNTSASSCAVGGWPALRRFDRADAPIPLRVQRWVYKLRGPAPFRMVALRPRAAATFDVIGSDWNHASNSPCPNARSLEVEPRGSGAWLSAASLDVPACGRGWEVGPLLPGRRVNPPVYALSMFYVPPTARRPFYSGRMNGTSWKLRVHDSGDGRYCFTVVTDGVPRAGRCGRMIGHEEPGKLGWIASSRGPSFVAGAVVSAATHMGITLSNGSTVYPRTMGPTRPLAPGTSFFFTTIPRGTHPVSLRGRTDRGGHVVEWPPEP
jgi:uncharacterized protein DUF4232